MSIPGAISLILLTLIIKPRKIIFLYGKKIKIFDIAKRIVSMYGYTLKKNPKYNYRYKYKLIGLKKGEKMHEILTYQEIK